MDALFGVYSVVDYVVWKVVDKVYSPLSHWEAQPSMEALLLQRAKRSPMPSHGEGGAVSRAGRKASGPM